MADMTGRNHSALASKDNDGGGTGTSKRALWRELPAGLSLAVNALPSSVVAGVLTYQALGPQYASAGLMAGLVAAVVGGFVGAVARSPTFIPTTPGVMAALLQATFAASIMAATESSALALAGIAVSAALAGVWQLAFGLAGWGAIARYVPHPVLAGFSAGVALLLLMDQFPKLLMAAPVGSRNASLSVVQPGILFAAVLVGVMLALAALRPRWPAPALGLLVAMAAYHLLESLTSGYALGGTAGTIILADVTKLAFPDPRLLLALPGDFWWALLGNSVAIAALGLLNTLLALRAAKMMTDTLTTPRREVAGLGAANIATAFAGAVPMITSLILLNASYRAGGRTRTTPLTACMALAAILVLAPSTIAAIPLVGLSALVVFFALRTFDRSMLEILLDALRPKHRRLRSRAIRNLGIFLAVALGTAFYQPAFGVLLGFILSCLVFIVDMSRPVIAARITGDRLRSRRGRPTADLDVLRTAGRRVAILRLRGVLFFGNADDLDNQLRDTDQEFDHVVLDMMRITDIDASGKVVLRATARRLAGRGKAVFVAGLKDDLAAFLGADLASFRDLDHALEHVEDLLLGSHAATPRYDFSGVEVLQHLSPEERDILINAISFEEYAAGGVLCRAGDPATGFWILLEGSVSIVVRGPEGPVRVAGIAPGSPVGELAVIGGQRRSADVVADAAVRAAFLDLDAFRRLKLEKPVIAHAILEWITNVTAQRLRTTSEALRFAES